MYLISGYESCIFFYNSSMFKYANVQSHICIHEFTHIHIQDLYIIFIPSFDTYREILCICVVYVILSLCMSLCVYVLLGEKVCVNIWDYVCSIKMLCSSYESCIFNCKSLKQRIIKSPTLNT